MIVSGLCSLLVAYILHVAVCLGTVSVLLMIGAYSEIFIFAVVEVEFERNEYSEEEGNMVEVCALLRGIAVREVSATFSTRPSVLGALGKSRTTTCF